MDIRSLITKASEEFAVVAAGHRCAQPVAGLDLWDCNRCWRKRRRIPLLRSRRTFRARAKRAIFLFMHGGPSSIDTFDPKPYLDANDGKPLAYQAASYICGGQDRWSDEVTLAVQELRPERDADQ